MTVRLYYSTDAGAPLLTPTAGSLIGLLDACLVDGYGSNAAAGWTKEFSDTNKAVYRQGGDTTSHKHYLRVEVQSPYYSAKVRGYINMTDVDTGTGMFPNYGQIPEAGTFVWFYASIVSPSRPWMLIATEKTFYLTVYVSGSADGTKVSNAPANGTYIPSTYTFGDILPYDEGDYYRCMIIGNTATSSNSNKFLGIDFYIRSFSLGYDHFMSSCSPSALALAAIPGSTAVSKTIDTVGTTAASPASAGYYASMMPISTNNKFLLSKVYITEQVQAAGGTINSLSYLIRGELPGVYFVPSKLVGFESGDVLTSVVGLEGKTLLYHGSCYSGTYGYATVEISDTW